MCTVCSICAQPGASQQKWDGQKSFDHRSLSVSLCVFTDILEFLSATCERGLHLNQHWYFLSELMEMMGRVSLW